ncbi:MAG: hypothetical protein Q9213_004745 [Squamulea squamosa]
MSLPNQAHLDNEQHWTQITDQALRKRVQNRMSQRKHRCKVRQQLDNANEAEPTSYLIDDTSLGNDVAPQTLFTPSDNASVHLQSPVLRDVIFGDSQPPSTGPLDAWSHCDAFDAVDLGATDLLHFPPSASSPTSSWSVSGQSTTQTPSTMSDTSFPPVLPNSGFPAQALPSSALPGPQWRVVGVQDFGSHNQGYNVQAAATGNPVSRTMSAPMSISSMPIIPQTYNSPGPYRQEGTNDLSSQSMSYNTQKPHCRGGSTSSCGQYGCHGSHHHSRPPLPLDHGVFAPATAMNPTAPDPACSGSAFDLSRYGIDINSLLGSPTPQMDNNNNNNGPRVIYVDEHQREQINHRFHCNQNCGHSAPRIQQEATQIVPQQSPRLGSNVGHGQGRVVVVYVQNTNHSA